jgi:hypothetical protein
MNVYVKDRYSVAGDLPRHVTTISQHTVATSESEQIWQRWFAADSGTRLGASAAPSIAMRLGETFESDIFGEGRRISATSLSFLDFEGERSSYGETPSDFEFHGYGQVRSLGLPDRDVHVCGLGHMVGGTPILKSFTGHVTVKDVEGSPWPDAPDAGMYNVRGFVAAPRERVRAHYRPPSRAYNACQELTSWLDVSVAELAKIIDVSRTTIANSWKNGKEPRNRAKNRRLFQLHSVVSALHQALADELVPWLGRGKPSPLQLLQSGEYERFERLADQVIFAGGASRPRLDTASPPRATGKAPTNSTLRMKPATRARSKRLSSDRQGANG